MGLGLKRGRNAASAAAVDATAAAAAAARRNRSPPRSSLGAKNPKWLGLFRGVVSAIRKSKSSKTHLSFEAGWSILKQGITTCSTILEHPAPKIGISIDEFTQCYDCASALVTQKKHFCPKLYDAFKEELTECVCTLAIPQFMDKQGDAIFEELVKVWKLYLIMVRSVSSFLCSLELSYLQPQNLPSLEKTAASSFFTPIFDIFKNEVTEALFLMFRQVRDGMDVDMERLVLIMDGINQSEVKVLLQEALVEDTEMYYSRKISKWMSEYSLADYLAKVQDTIEKERMWHRLVHIEQDTSEFLLEAVRDLIMKDYNDFSLPVLVGNHHLTEVTYVGIINESVTCHMNCVLQVLFHIPCFKKAICEVNYMPTGSLVSSLRRLFHKLQYSTKAVSAKVVIKSLSWNLADSSMHQDVGEQYSFLLDKIEKEVEGTNLENLTNTLFSGCMKEEIWIGANCVSTTNDIFNVLHIPVEGLKGVYSSFDQLVKENVLESYKHECDATMVAERKYLFTKLPPILVLNLARPVHDARKSKTVKVNDRYEFPFKLDLDREDGKYLSSEADRSIRNEYLLHSVIAHSGKADKGHYFAIIRPNLSENWVMFNDSVVAPVSSIKKVEELFGGSKKGPNAYLLVYIRQADIQAIFHEARSKDGFSCTKEDTNDDVQMDLESQVSETPKELRPDLLARRTIGPGLSIFEFYRHLVRIYKMQVSSFSVKHFLRCELLLQLLAVYSGFHAVLFSIDWATETTLTQEVHKTVARGAAWFFVLVIYLILLRHLSVKRQSKDKTALNVIEEYLKARRIQKPKPPRTAAAEENQDDLRVVSVRQVRREEDSELSLAMVLSAAKLIFETIKDVGEESMEKTTSETGKDMDIWIRWWATAHSCALAVEVVGSYLVRLIFRTGGPPPPIDTSAW